MEILCPICKYSYEVNEWDDYRCPNCKNKKRFDFKIIPKMHYWFIIAFGLFGSVIGLVNLYTFVKVYQSTFEYYGIPKILMYSLPILGFIGFVILGFIMIKSGYQKIYAQYASDTNPDWIKMKTEVSWIKNKLEEK